MRIALFASGNGSNVQAIIEAVDNKQLEADIVCLFCDKPGAYVLERAAKIGLDTFVAQPSDYATRQDWEKAIVQYLKGHKVDLIVLAGFMRIIGDELLNNFPIINIHPALLPAFPGAHGIEDAFNAGVEETGVTVHWVDNGIDTGPIIAQEHLNINPEWQLADLEEKIHAIEHELYPRTIQYIIDNWDEMSALRGGKDDK